jgi:hypothetical protein
MSHYDYLISQEISAKDPPFASLIMAAMRKADSDNTALLANAFPEIFYELRDRYNAPGGFLPEEIYLRKEETK